MKKTFLYLLLSMMAFAVHAAQNPDSLAYQLQRKKINSMLDVRRQKFGQYDQSLSMHTGIFGLQTKKDIRRSNDILMDIVKTDDEIFRQLKILLDYRAFEQTQAQSHSSDVETDALTYMNVINKLRDQLEKIKKENDEERKEQEKMSAIYLSIIGILILSVLFLIMRKKTVKT